LIFINKHKEKPSRTNISGGLSYLYPFFKTIGLVLGLQRFLRKTPLLIHTPKARE